MKLPYKYIATVSVICVISQAVNAHHFYWSSVEGICGGSVCTITETEEGSLFAGTKNGIYYAEDKTGLWKFKGLADKWIYCLIQNESGYLFAGTFSGLYRSKDMGTTWKEIKSGKYLWVRDIIIGNDNKLIMCSDYGNFYSMDNGDTWAEIDSLSMPVSTLFNFQNQYIIAACGDNGIYRSCDNGVSWQKTIDIFPAMFSITSDLTGRLWAGCWGGFVCFSNDSGETWSRLNHNMELGHVNAFTMNAENHLILGDEEGHVYVSRTSGQTWENRLTIYESINCIIVDEEGYILTGTDGAGIYYSKNDTSWDQSIKGMNNYTITVLVANSDNQLYAVKSPDFYRYDGTSEYSNLFDKIYRSRDNGMTWEKISSTSYVINDLINHPNGSMFGGTDNNGIICSEDSGKTWSVVGGESWISISKLAINSNGELFAGIDGFNYGGIYYSSDSGKTWVEKSDGLPNAGIDNLIVDHDDKIFVSSWFGIYKSINHGDSWEQCLDHDSYGTTITISQNNDIYIGNSEGKLLKSEDHGIHWYEIELNSDVSKINSIKMTDDNQLFLGTDNGIYISNDHGISWTMCNKNLPFNEIDCIELLSSDQILISVRGSGLYVSKIETNINTDLNTEKRDFHLLQNYPNPFNHSTKISYYLSESGNVSLKIYNISGQVIQTLIHEYQVSGEYKINWDSNGLPSGIYLYELKTDAISETNKLIIHK
ncbi:T9SS type A sorting domain-containing protein [bacterium]|nr:T9SS type A sorting domain-containing protein [bacterium]